MGYPHYFFSENPKAPASIITEFRQKNPGDRPQFKVALIDSDIYVGDEQLASLKSLKTKQELLGEIITQLQSPSIKVLSSLKSGADTLGRLLKALEQRA